MKYTAAEIKNIGGKRFLKRRKKWIALTLFMSIAWMPLLKWLTIDIKLWVYFAPLALVLANLAITYYQSRNRFYRAVKRNPEILGKSKTP